MKGSLNILSVLAFALALWNHPVSAEPISTSLCHSEKILGFQRKTKASNRLSLEKTTADPKDSDPPLKLPEKWRKIDIIVDIPRDYSVDPETGQLIDRDSLIANVRTIFALTQEFFKPLRLYLNVIKIEIIEPDDTDPYETAYLEKDAFKMLKTAVARWESSEDLDYDLIVVLARRHFAAGSGLAYPSTSCELRKYSVVFASQGGSTPSHAYTHAQTLAHEIGHFLGMAHDSSHYGEGPSVMWHSFVQYTTGFSPVSLREALDHSGPGKAGGSCFEIASTEDSPLVADSDGDGIDNIQEDKDATDPEDPGSYRMVLKNPIFTLWNSFLDMVNIVELVNPQAENLQAEVSLYDLSGRLLHVKSVNVPAYGQLDLIINDFPGFAPDTYGLLKIVFEGQLSGRTSYYRNDNQNGGFEFAYSVPFLNPSYGRTVTSFNTHQPSSNPNEQEDSVPNWLTLVNLASKAKSFQVYSFDAEGKVLHAESIRVPSLGRRDIDGGHGFAGHSVTGFHEIVAADPHAPYMAQLTRYGTKSASGSVAPHYHFAYPLIARAGSGRPTSLFVSARFPGEENWLELTNTHTGKVLVGLQLTDSPGKELAYAEVYLEPHRQIHLDISKLLRTNGALEGLLTISPDVPNSILAQGMSYYRDEKTGSITSMYGSQSREALGSSLAGSYNTFLRMENWIKVGSTSSVPAEAKISVLTPAGMTERTVTIAANGMLLLPIHETGLFKAVPATYGLVTVEPSIPGTIISEVLRLRYFRDTIDFASPTLVW